ncbi:MAG TPA: tripartite tricarboxylate transporter TctB family protein [Hyphomicrobiaceae bacterium]
MTQRLLIAGLRLLFPVGAIVFSIAFYFNIRHMGRSETIFPDLLIAGLLLIAALVLAQEFRALWAVRQISEAEAVGRLDVDGLRSSGWWRSLFVALSCLLYLLSINRLGLLPAAFLAYVTCAVPLFPDRSAWQSWLRCLVGAAVAALLLDTVFRVWLGLPLPAPLPS